MEKKYELVKEDSIKEWGYNLYRIRALKDFNNVKKGDLGGYIAKEQNLSHDGDCWVHNNAKVFGNARVCDDAEVYNNARVCDNARVYGNAKVYGNARVFNNAKVYGNARVYSNADISNTTDYITIGPIGSRNDYTTFYLSKDKTIYAKCGCFNGSIDEFKDKVNETHKDNDKYRNDYLSVIEVVKKVLL